MKKCVFFCLLLCVISGCTRSPGDHEIISTTRAPAAIGPYSQGVRVGNTLYLSGQLGIVPETGDFAKGGFEAQATQAMENQKAVLEAAGFSLDNVVQCQVFVKDMNQYPLFNDIYTQYFNKDFPARAVLEVERIPKDGVIEIMMIAVL